ncbi:hypothetical protein E4U42_003037 [Claviceps africana]|uniref:Uncharacterized protein n=1 Tax=Claviceps africana TaxID=83212 RepID=A0A8K0NI59_9HYPO|nr:hypothetical protein E4U42_003037 [Claviceps africana]
MSSALANVADTEFERKASEIKQSGQSPFTREVTAFRAPLHSDPPDEGYDDGHETASRVSKMNTSEERARKTGEMHGEVMEPPDVVNMSPVEAVFNVGKRIKMRVRRVCHRCNTTFAAKSECSKCRHVRCEQCPRYPLKENEADSPAHLEETEVVVRVNHENSPILADLFWGNCQVELRRPSKTGGQDLVHRKPRQRVRRTCHECQTLFTPGSKTCADCGHTRCTDCPRDPDKYPFGYPGDVLGPKTDARFECLSCQTPYPVQAENGTSCQTCGLEKSGESPRSVPRKIQPIPDPDVLFKLQATLAGLASSSL